MRVWACGGVGVGVGGRGREQCMSSARSAMPRPLITHCLTKSVLCFRFSYYQKEMSFVFCGISKRLISRPHRFACRSSPQPTSVLVFWQR